MSIRTDLAAESLELNNKISGVTKTQNQSGNVLVIKIEVKTEEAANLLQKSKGEYITFHVSDFKSPTAQFEEEVLIIAKELEEIFPPNEKGVLVVGLGNSEITPDALGPKAISYIFATRHIDDELKKNIGMEGIRSVSAIAPGVLGQTGIESAEVVLSLTKQLSPSFVVVIDALAAKSIDRLGTTVQVSNAGISPGSGVQNARKELNEATLGVPVISVGVPMVVDMTTIAHDMLDGKEQPPISEAGRTMMVTPREIDVVIEHAAKLVAFAINKALQQSLSITELVSLVG